MTTHPPNPEPSESSLRRPSAFLEWLPWEKLTIWGSVLLIIYLLRDFFFLIFMTFILTYILRSVIVRVLWLIRHKREEPWLERLLAVVCFLLLLLGLFGAGYYLSHPLEDQYHKLTGRVGELDPDEELRNFGGKTFGFLLFKRQYGDPDDEAYRGAFEEYSLGKRPRTTAYEEFRVKLGEDENSRREFEQEERNKIQAQVDKLAKTGEDFENWFVTEKSPLLYEKEKADYIKRWREHYRLMLQELSEQEIESRRQSTILQFVFEEVKKDPADLVQYKEEWKKERTDDLTAARKRSPEYDSDRQKVFREDYERRHEKNRSRYPWPFEEYLELRKAHAESELAFTEALGMGTKITVEKGGAKILEEQLHEDFQNSKQRKMFDKWWDGDTGKEIRGTVLSYSKAARETSLVWIKGAIEWIFELAIELSTSLLLCLLITFGFPTLREGVKKLSRSRVAGFYAEIAPGLMSFGHLIGRAFQAQGVIAIFNTLLTLLAIRILHIENEVFLCVVVFLCSFIPILGVVLSSVPIAVMAIIQENGGSVDKAFYMILAILLIHFIETSILNPKILGDMLHLHPVLVLTILLVAAHFFGVWGLLLGVPVSVYIIRFVILREGIPGFMELPSGHQGGGAITMSHGAPALSIETGKSLPGGPLLPKPEKPASTKAPSQVDNETEDENVSTAKKGEATAPGSKSAAQAQESEELTS